MIFDPLRWASKMESCSPQCASHGRKAAMAHTWGFVVNFRPVLLCSKIQRVQSEPRLALLGTPGLSSIFPRRMYV